MDNILEQGMSTSDQLKGKNRSNHTLETFLLDAKKYSLRTYLMLLHNNKSDKHLRNVEIFRT